MFIVSPLTHRYLISDGFPVEDKRNKYYLLRTIKFLDLIHRPDFYLKQNISRTGFCLLYKEG
jgi:hypothetical protein